LFSFLASAKFDFQLLTFNCYRPETKARRFPLSSIATADGRWCDCLGGMDVAVVVIIFLISSFVVVVVVVVSLLLRLLCAVRYFVFL
jgi:hypothetical protein